MLSAPTLFLMFSIPETLSSQVLMNKARRIRRAKIPGYENVLAPVEATDRKLASIFTVALVRPWIILFDTISLLCAIYLSVVYMLLYMLFTIYPFVFQEMRGWNAGVGELPLIGTVIGACIAGAYVFWNTGRDLKKTLAGHQFRPEDRLHLAMVGGVLFPVTMFWFAWTAEYNSIHWIVPTLAGVFLSASILLIFVGFLNYITDSYLMFAASALAANTVARSACGAAAPLFTEQMFTTLGVGGGGSLIGGLAVLLAPIPFIFYRYGEGIRKRSKFAPTPDKKPDEEKGEVAETGSNHHRTSASSDVEERELDEQAGVPDPQELSEEISEEQKEAGIISPRHAGDPYLDASGAEKAEIER